MSRPRPARGSGPGLAARLALSLAGLAAVVAVLEVGSYLVLTRVLGGPTYRERIRDATVAGTTTPAVSSPFHPYLGWIHAAGIEIDTSKSALPGRVTAIVTDATGASITPLTHARPELQVAVLGGSTMFGVGSSDNARTVPSQLERLVAEEAGIRAEVHNWAVRGYQAFQETLWLYRRIQEQRLDLVLAISGRNDAFYAITSPALEYAFLPPQVWTDTVGPVHALEQGAARTWLRVNPGALRASSYTIDLLSRLGRRKRGEAGGAPASPDAFRGMEHLIARPATLEERAGLTDAHYGFLAEVCRRHGARFILLLQPTAFTKAVLSEEEQERVRRRFDGDADRARRYGAGERAFYAALRARPASYDRRDLTGAFGAEPGTLYIDHAHYNDRGAELLARAVLASIRPDLDRLVAARRARAAGGRPAGR